LLERKSQSMDKEYSGKGTDIEKKNKVMFISGLGKKRKSGCPPEGRKKGVEIAELRLLSRRESGLTRERIKRGKRKKVF